MSDQEILTKAIEKAIARGWHKGKFERDSVIGVLSVTGSPADPFLTELANHLWFKRTYPSIIFDHDFAKALFGEEVITATRAKRDLSPGFVKADEVGALYSIESFKFHLQQMVVAEDPIKYLGDHLNA